MLLFLDTTHLLRLGLFDLNKNEWVDYKLIDTKKTSDCIHYEIHQLCNHHNITPIAIEEILYCAGPGTYTGMRVAEGIANIFELQGTKIFSFFQFEVPFLLDLKNMVWVANAYKGELFLCDYHSDRYSSTLIKKDEFKRDSGKVYYGIEDDIEGPLINTPHLFYENASLLIPLLRKRGSRQDLFYYRSIESEFKRP